MKSKPCILLLIFISSLILTNSVDGSDLRRRPESSTLLDGAKDAVGPIPPVVLHEAKPKPKSEDEDLVSSTISFISVESDEDVAPVSSILEEAEKSLGPVSSSDLEALGPAASVDEAKDALGPVTPEVVEEAKKTLRNVSFDDDDVLDKADDQLSSTISSILSIETKVDDAPVSSSISSKAHKAFSPAPANRHKTKEKPHNVLDPFSILDEPTKARSPETDLAPAPAPTPFPPKPRVAPAPAPSPSGYFDQDVALAIETRIKQGLADAQRALDEANRLLTDRKFASMETGICLRKCVDEYAASVGTLNKAVRDLGARDAALLADDFNAVEEDLSVCQACFKDKIGEDSPLKNLEEATTKAARECLTVLDYAR